MALFTIIGHDVENSSKQRKITRPEHLAYIEELNKQGKIIIGGPNPIDHHDLEKGMYGSTIIADFDSLEEAHAWCNNEPYLRDGVYSHFDIKPFLQIMPKFTNL